MLIVKHFNWNTDDLRGRLAIALNEDRVSVVQLAGNAIPVEGLMLIQHEIGKMVKEAGLDARALNARRVNRYAVQTRAGMSGCRDYLLRVERDAAIADYPIAARLHVSCAGKLNQAIHEMWIGDWAILAPAATNDHEFCYGIEKGPSHQEWRIDSDATDSVSIWWREAPVFEPEGGWQTAAEPTKRSGSIIEEITSRRIFSPNEEIEAAMIAALAAADEDEYEE